MANSEQDIYITACRVQMNSIKCVLHFRHYAKFGRFSRFYSWLAYDSCKRYSFPYVNAILITKFIIYILMI